MSVTAPPEAQQHPPDEELTRTWEAPPGIIGFLSAVSHKNVGKRYIVAAFALFLVGGVEALFMRIQLARPENQFLDPQTYNALFTMHGSTMMYLFIVPFLEGLGNYVLPLMLGARDLPFPRLNAFNFWLYLFGGAVLYSSFLFGAVPTGGWYAYPPLTLADTLPGRGMDFWLIGITMAEISAIGAAIELIVVIVKQRAPGMSLNRIPLFAWAMLAASAMIVVGFSVLLFGSVLLQFDRTLGTHFFTPTAGGDPVLWQHLFWIFGHPEVYIMFLPATGIVSQVVATFSRRGIVAYPLVVASIIATAVFSFGLWVHHMFTVGIPLISLGMFAAASYMITFPSGIQIFAWITTLWRGTPRRGVPLLYVLAFVVTFVLGGITGVMVASVPFDWQVHDTYFLIAHFHYVLIGGVVFPAFAAIYYWWPKATGRQLHPTLSRLGFWLVTGGFNLAFFPMHVSGLLGMPRRVYTYDAGVGLSGWNLASTIGALVLALGVAATVADLAWSRWRGPKAGADPHGGDTLEWSTSSPPPPENFALLPVVDARDPLWQQTDRVPANRRHREVVEALAREPTRWRATLGTTPGDAQPSEIIFLPGPTLAPLVAAGGALLIAAGLLLKVVLVIAAGAVVLIAGGVHWLWSNETQRHRNTHGFTLAGLEVDALGTAATGWWGGMFFLAAFASILVSAVFSYFFLQIKSPRWPPSVAALPELWPAAAIGGVLLVVALAATAAARRSPKTPPRLLLWGMLIAGTGVVVGLAAEYARQPFTYRSDAYGSSFFALLVLSAATVVVGLGVTGVAQLVAARLGAGRRLQLLAGNAAIVWWYALATWTAVALTVYVSPRLT